MKKAGVYVRALRLPFVSASVIPALIAVTWAWVYGQSFDLLNSLLAVLGVMFLHLGANVINDYFDTEGSDRINRFPTPFSGGSRVVLEGLMTKREILHLALFCFAMAGVFGGILVFRGRPHVLTLGVVGFLCGFLYSWAPIQLMSRGIGEAVIFFAFGPLITLGTGYAVEGVFSWAYFLMGVPMGFIVTDILWVNEFPDFEADASAGKRNLVVRLGLSRARYGYAMIAMLFYLSIICLAISGVYSYYTLAALITVPAVLKATSNLWLNYDNPPKLVASQATTIQTQTVAGVLIVAGLFVDKWL